jgi:hypothetical protein
LVTSNAQKLEELITQFVIKSGSEDGCSSIPSELIPAAVKAASLLTPADIAKMPDLWYPTQSAKKAGAPKPNEGWGRLWFDALVEDGQSKNQTLRRRNRRRRHERMVQIPIRLIVEAMGTH